MTDKVDFKKSFDAQQAQRGKFRFVNVPDMQYLMIDGHGDPNTTRSTSAISAGSSPRSSAPYSGDP